MKKTLLILLTAGLFFTTNTVFANKLQKKLPNTVKEKTVGFIDAADYGFLPTETGTNNTKALQVVMNKEGTIVISKPGTYKMAGTAYIGDNTSLIFGNGVIVEKSAENGAFTHVFLNKGALTRTYNHNITITGLNLKVNGVDKVMDAIFGLRGQLAFFYVKNLKIVGFRCTDLAKGQFCLHICTFEDLLINDAVIKGDKDGIHLGKGKRFRISNVVFDTADDAIALVPGDWVNSNPEFGDLENGLIENCHDLKDTKGAFVKLVGSAWVDWKPGIEVRHGDAFVSEGKIYRVLAKNDNKSYKSITRPAFEKGTMELDGIKWLMFQTDTIHTAVVKDVTFRDIFLESVEIPFQLTNYEGGSSHSYYKGAPLPIHTGLSFENITVLNDAKRALLWISAVCDIISIRNTTFRNNHIGFRLSKDIENYPPTYLNLSNCIFKNNDTLTLIDNKCVGKEIFLKTSGSMETGKNFSAKVEQGPGTIHVVSDLTGLKM